MCGIIGVLALGAAKEDLRTDVMRFLFTELLQLTEERGKDATGVSALFSDGMSYIQKGPITATEFIGNLGDEETTYNSFLNNCDSYSDANEAELKLFMGHCRKSSVGGAFDNVNNHPIKVGEIVGVHNGTLENHNKVFTNLDCKRDGVVDTEAIMRLLNHYTNYCTDPFTIEGMEETAKRLEGAYSVLAYNANNPFQVCIMRKERPFEIALIRDYGIMLIASDKAFFVKALYQYNKFAYLFNNDFKPIDVEEVEAFTLPLDNVGIINLNVDVTDDTVIEDLILRKDVFKSEKLWRMPTKTYGKRTTYNGHQHVNNNVGKKNDIQNGTKETTATTQKDVPVKDDFKGKVFCKRLNAYVNQEKIDENKSAGPKVVSINGGKVQDLKQEELIDFKEVKDLTITAKEQAVPIIMSEVKAVDATLAEAMKAATAHENFNTRFSNSKEVIDALDIRSEDTLDSIPAFALVNKTKDTVYKEAFVDGALWYKETHSDADNTVDPTAAVRIAKHVVEVFGNVMCQLANGREEDYASKILMELKKKNITELTLENVRRIFSKGDKISCKALVALEDVI